MGKKSAVIIALAMGMTIFTVVNFSMPALALPDHSLGGKVYLCNNSQALNGTAWEDSTEFAIWTNDTIATPPFFKWTRYPQSGWYLTDKGYYSAVLPYADKNVNWSHGSEYRVEFNAGPAVPARTNATSNGTGSSVTSGGAIPEEGDPEYSGFGNVSNSLAYWEWGLPVQTDDFQWWDVIINCADLMPADVTVNAPGGVSAGPLNAPFAVPNAAAISINPNEPVVLNSSVRNNGSTFVNRTSTIMFWNQTGGLLDWFVTGHTMPVPANGVQVPVPKQAIWPGSPSPGIYFLYVTVDYPTVFTEYNSISGFLPPYGNITEVDDTDIDVYPNTNNTVRIRVTVGNPALPDLIPGNLPVPTDILFDGSPVAGATGTPPVSNQITIADNTWFQISSTVTNVGNGDAPASDIAFYNCTQFGGQLDPPFNITPVPALTAGSSSSAIMTMWLSPGMGIHSYVCIEVDYNNDVAESEESNNTYIIHLYTSVGNPDLIPYDAITEMDIKINGGSFAPPVSGNMSITITTGQVIEILTKPSNDGLSDAGSFDMGFFDNVPGGTTPEASPSYDFNIASLAMGTAYQTPQTQTYVKYYTQEGTYYIFLWVDYNNVVPEDPNESNNILIIEVSVFDLPPPPEPMLDADDDNGNVSVSWSNVTGEDIVSYNIYWAESPEELNFTAPQATVVASGASITYNHIAGVTAADELYYVVCSVDVRGWEGPSSDVMGKFTVQIPAGYSTFSLPLEPFDNQTHSADWYLEDMDIDETDAIFSYDAGHQKWIPHPKFLPDTVSNFDLAMGETYMLFARAGKDHYTFVGYPGTSLRYIGGADNAIDELDDPRIGTTQAYRDSLWASEVGGNVVLTWSWGSGWNVSNHETVGGFNIYRATSRAGFGFSSAPYATITGLNLTWTDQNAGGDEYYYMVVPTVELTGREGSSALAIGLKRVTYEMGYSDFALFLRPMSEDSMSDHLGAMGLSGAETMGAIFWFDNYGIQRWIPHAAFLPDAVADHDTDIGQGNMIYLLITKDYTMIGR